MTLMCSLNIIGIDGGSLKSVITTEHYNVNTRLSTSYGLYSVMYIFTGASQNRPHILVIEIFCIIVMYNDAR